MRPFRFGLVLAGSVCAALATGCGAKPIPTKGVVLCDRKPLANAAVMFHAQDPDGRDATGQTDANGVFELTTFRLKDGALPGSYKVTVRYSEPIKVSPELKTAEDVQRAMVEAGAGKRPTIVLPESCTRPDQTVLKHRVPEDG